jgi:hypothetical protein
MISDIVHCQFALFASGNPRFRNGGATRGNARFALMTFRTSEIHTENRRVGDYFEIFV